MRIALLSYRSKTHCGGQGVYVRHLSAGLVELGHEVEVFSGQPYPEVLDPRVPRAERDAALASGAHFVSTDYPVPDPNFSDYQVTLPGGNIARCNPVNPGNCTATSF